MANKHTGKRHARVPILFVLSLIVAFVYALVNIFLMQADLNAKQAEYEMLQQQLRELETKNAELERYTDEEYRTKYVEEIARTDLGYSYSDETIYYFIPEG